MYVCVYVTLQPSIKVNQFTKPEIIKSLYKPNDELDDENNEVSTSSNFKIIYLEHIIFNYYVTIVYFYSYQIILSN